MIEVSVADFEVKLKSGKYIVMFYTTWCPRCPPMLKALEELEREAGSFVFAKINFDENREVAEFFQVVGVPATMALSDAHVLYVHNGAEYKDALRERIASLEQGGEKPFSLQEYLAEHDYHDELTEQAR